MATNNLDSITVPEDFDAILEANDKTVIPIYGPFVMKDLSVCKLTWKGLTVKRMYLAGQNTDKNEQKEPKDEPKKVKDDQLLKINLQREILTAAEMLKKARKGDTMVKVCTGKNLEGFCKQIIDSKFTRQAKIIPFPSFQVFRKGCDVPISSMKIPAGKKVTIIEKYSYPSVFTARFGPYIGPVTLDELHASSQYRFIIEDTDDEKTDENINIKENPDSADGTSPSTSNGDENSQSTSNGDGTSPSTSNGDGTSPSTSNGNGTAPSTSNGDVTSPITSNGVGTSPSTSKGNDNAIKDTTKQKTQKADDKSKKKKDNDKTGSTKSSNNEPYDDLKKNDTEPTLSNVSTNFVLADNRNKSMNTELTTNITNTHQDLLNHTQKRNNSFTVANTTKDAEPIHLNIVINPQESTNNSNKSVEKPEKKSHLNEDLRKRNDLRSSQVRIPSKTLNIPSHISYKQHRRHH